MLELLIIGVVGAGVLLLVPVLLLCLLGRIVLELILLPFRLFGLVVGALAGVLGFAIKAVVAAAAVLLGGALLLGGLVILPLIPVVAAALMIWLLARLLRPRPQPLT